MKIPEMIEVLQAAERGEAFEVLNPITNKWSPVTIETMPAHGIFNADYRIAPKRTLVEELCEKSFISGDLRSRAANRIVGLEALYEQAQARIEELEKGVEPAKYLSTDELLEELKRRVLE